MVRRVRISPPSCLSISHPVPSLLLILVSGSAAFVLGFVCLRSRQTKCASMLPGQSILAKKEKGEKRGHEVEYAGEATGRAFSSRSWDCREAIQCLQASVSSFVTGWGAG